MTEPYVKAIPLFQSGGLSDEETPPSSTIIGYLPMIMDQENHVHAYALSEHRVWTELHTFVVPTPEEAVELYKNYNGDFKTGYYEHSTRKVFLCQSCALMKYPKRERDIFADIE